MLDIKKETGKKDEVQGPVRLLAKGDTYEVYQYPDGKLSMYVKTFGLRRRDRGAYECMGKT